MSSCLYECLREAGLAQYYTRVTAMGFLKSQDLVKLTVNDYSVLGMHDMRDQKRLFQLIQIIKAVQNEDHDTSASTECSQAGALNVFVEKVKPGPRRQLNFECISNNERSNNSQLSEPSSHPQLSSCENHLQDTPSGLSKPPSPVDQLPVKLCRKEMHSLPEKEDNYSTIQNTKTILHVSGYNYGLPHSVSRPASPGKAQTWTETEKIHVCVRKRPLRVREVRRGEIDVAKVEENKSVLIHEKKEAVDLKQYLQQHVFYFDEAFEETCTNYDVYLKTAYPLIQHVFSGGMATCFAYGQTGAGKTYTMIGTDQNPGLYALAAEDIFMHLQTSEQDRALFIWISFYEIYCGQLYDLLNMRKKLFAREDGNHTVQIVGLREIQVDAVQSLLEVISWGSKARSTGASGINADSSRSHAIIQIQLKNLNSTIVGRISFIDLAGSERAADARDSDKQTKIEGAEINQSLLALKECIRALDQEHPHTPFRQSKLTLVLKDSFVGNSKTCMIANISPSHVATEHTLNTLRYADRVKELKRGTKTSSAIYTGCQGVRSPSPKRTKETPCTTWREKPMQKNMKLRIEQSPCETKNTVQPKSTSSAFHSPNVLLCSTSKMANKNVLLQASSKDMWLSYTTTNKEILKTGSLDIKKCSKDKSSTEKSCITKECFLTNPKTGKSKIIQHRQKKDLISENQSYISRNVKVQAVYPIQKEIISKTRFHCTEQVINNCSSNKRNSENFGNESPKTPESTVNIHLLQKERERHLRLYHQQLQQLQQSPLTQKKLCYQPLKELLGHIYQPKIRMNDEEIKCISSLRCDVQRSDNQNEYSSNCDSSYDYQCLNDRENQIDDNQPIFCEVSKGELKERNHVQEFLLCQNQHISPKVEDNNKITSLWNTGEDCTVAHSSGVNPKQTAYIQNSIGQEHLNHLSTDSKNTARNRNQHLSSYQQDDSAAPSQHAQMNSNLSLDLKATKARDTTSFQSSTAIDSDLTLQSPLKRVIKDVQMCDFTNNIISSTDIISEDLLSVSDCQPSVEKPPLKVTIPLNEELIISSNQLSAEMDVSLVHPCNKAQVSSPPFGYIGKWMAESHDHLDQGQKFQPGPFFQKKHICCNQNYIWNDEIEVPMSVQGKNNQCSSINDPESNCKDSNILTMNSLTLSTKNRKDFQKQQNQEASVDASPCGNLLSSGTNHTSECNSYKQGVKCSKSEFCADTEGNEISSSILHLNCGASSSAEDETMAYHCCSNAGVQNTTDLFVNQMTISDIMSNPTISSNETTEQIKNPGLKEPNQETNDLEAVRNTGETLEGDHNEFQLQCKSNHKDLIDTFKEKLLQNTSVQFSNISAEQDSVPTFQESINHNIINNRATGHADDNQSRGLNSQHLEAVEKVQKLIVQAHCEHLEDMLGLFEKEECLLNKLSMLDFKDYMTQVEEILMQKNKCIERMQGQIHKYHIHAGTVCNNSNTKSSVS
ncbi:kinesin-like protein KIF24 isoform X1 [Stegostoma tigrinum]|uniref:kinesin-like protein KIF24 isoform X1 n=2 Tax=Stegostoma tigrinum TaxID=3053191 RepID=UPI00287005E3|nr:kinesin-like protein KIF24 isoform X1 [Stegostoma tigrinum]XP_059505083.1 kinesin-like protein KIF24 isoform X1 [Stegostoma tigrinum]XP_059505085.1 kinesin-like protein KIF24 isoform X1 [Stegostoma tigrinum]